MSPTIVTAHAVAHTKGLLKKMILSKNDCLKPSHADSAADKLTRIVEHAHPGTGFIREHIRGFVGELG